MKSFFSARVSKLNMLMAVWALGVTTFSLPVAAAPQEVCVRTESGDVVCGKPVPKPTKTPIRTIPDSDETIQTTVSTGVTWDLKSCVRNQSTVSCTFSLSPSGDGNYGIDMDSETKLVDGAGNEYSGSKIQIGKRATGAGGRLDLNMAKGSRYKTIIDFNDVPNSISKVTLLQISIRYWGGTTVKFRNVPVN
jgi:hypothetical protein